MPLPNSSIIEVPVLQELIAVGGTDDVRYLYERLIAYFPQISQKEVYEIRAGKNRHWRTAVQKAGKNLDEQKLIERERGIWTITNLGETTVADEISGFTLSKIEAIETTHIDIQNLLAEIGDILGYETQMEFEYYDVIWRNSSNNARLSHVFEVQSKGNIDSAFAKLKRAYEAQRSKPFLIISTERDLNRARQSLVREFQELEKVLTILTFQQIIQVHQNTGSIREILGKFLEN